MPSKRLPHNDESKIKVLRQTLDQEELSGSENKILSILEYHELRTFLISYESTYLILQQSMQDEKNAESGFGDYFATTQMYISHFLQVLYLSVVRNEIKPESLIFYGFEEGKEVRLPHLSTEEEILEWGKRIINGENERIQRGGTPLYNPAVSKVKVHYDRFCELLYSLKIYRQNTSRARNRIQEMREKARILILDIWTRVEEKYLNYPSDVRSDKYKSYLIDFYYSKGEQMNVFD